MKKHTIKTPHAAVIIWNYDDRLGSEPTAKLNDVEQVIISTVSCKSISTSKTKSNPEGRFNIELAPFKNWISTITSGSWCAILMSNEPITKEDINGQASYAKLKMFGKIDSVRASVSVGAAGERITTYSVSGVDWGYIFHNNIYVDNRIPNAKENNTTQANSLAIDINKSLFSADGTALIRSVHEMLREIIAITGKPLKFDQAGSQINRITSSVYNFTVPSKVLEYFGFIQGDANKKTESLLISDILSVITGNLKSKDSYSNKSEACGYINPMSLLGVHTFWQVLLEHSNAPMNEMFAEMRWEKVVEKNGKQTYRPKLALYNRIKPFSLKSGGIRSQFKNVRHHLLDPLTVVAVDAGTNWRDKFNFTEIKPNFENLTLYENWYATKSQRLDPLAFNREGFRPLIVETRQFPFESGNTPADFKPNYDELASWSELLKEWYFDIHRMLNGTIALTGVDSYIAVGDNIKFDAGLLNPSPNMNQGQVAKKTTENTYILAHVETISHSFRVDENGARNFTTNIQFVRGILVNSSNEPISEGKLDKFASSVKPTDDRNRTNIISSSDGNLDPDSQKPKGD